MSKKISFTSFDYEPVKIVPVVASFDGHGNIKPMYIRINGDIYKIDEYWIKSELHNQINFNCMINCNNHMVPQIVTYHTHECLWTIPDNDS